jgi:putative tricarboxylic transport membrane protein
MKRNVTRLGSTLIAVGLVAATGWGAVAQSAVGKFPRQPVLFVVAGQPGGGADVQARNIIAAIDRAKIIDQPAAVLNKGGGGAQEPFTFTASQRGNPHYLLATTAQFITYTLTGQAAYTLDQFTPIASLIADPSVVVVPASSPYKNLKDLIEAAKANPGKINYGGGVTGTQDHMSLLTLQKETGTKFNFVSFGGGGELHAAVLGAQVDVANGNPSDFLSSMQAGRLRCLAILSKERNTAPTVDQCPTAIEQGYNVTWEIFRGWSAPTGISEADVKGLEEMLRAVTKDPTFQKDYIQKNGQRLEFLDHTDFSERLAADKVRFTELLTQAGILK